ncbi:hypothetical protein Ocin01_02177 [Orchesella cincta]|uniref:Uncharacterized protein n=1 Tax=Orchesella cincta TaxID=48709 RepID=A0A1D2NHL6_ORCCI|nr:hypothetical protein Ocin01_02177 [Orchesella cincta]
MLTVGVKKAVVPAVAPIGVGYGGHYGGGHLGHGYGVAAVAKPVAVSHAHHGGHLGGYGGYAGGLGHGGIGMETSWRRASWGTWSWIWSLLNMQINIFFKLPNIL